MWWKNISKIIFISLIATLPFFASCCVHHQNQNPFFGAHTLRKAKTSVVKINGHTSIEMITTSTASEFSMDYRITASGAIINHYKDISVILTAAHVCGLLYDQQLSMFDDLVGPEEYIKAIKVNTTLSVTDVEGRTFDALQIYAQKRSDTCIMITKRIPQIALELALEEPAIGEKAWNIGLPHGIWAPNFIPMFDGRFIGHHHFRFDRSKISCYSIPAAPGQSGSPIINSFGQVTGMIHSVYKRYNHLSLSSTLEQIKHVSKQGMMRLESGYKKYYKDLDK